MAGTPVAAIFSVRADLPLPGLPVITIRRIRRVAARAVSNRSSGGGQEKRKSAPSTGWGSSNRQACSIWRGARARTFLGA